MAAAKGYKPPNAGKGRVKGVPNKSTREAREAIELAFQGLGGVDALIAWGKVNPDCFYGTVFPKLLPVQVKHSGDADNPIVQEIRRVIVGKSDD